MRWEELNIEISLSFVFSFDFKLHDFPADFPSCFQWCQQGEICISNDLQDADSTFSRDFRKFWQIKIPTSFIPGSIHPLNCSKETRNSNLAF